MLIIFPGLIGSAAISNNLHAYHLWIATLLNGLIYFGLGWFSFGLVARVFTRGTPGSRRDRSSL